MKRAKRKRDINKKTGNGMVTLQFIFDNKRTWINGLTKDETISLYYKIPLPLVLKMAKETKEKKWKEIIYIRRYLRNRLTYAIDYKSVGKGVILFNNEFGKRELKQRTNVFFRVSTLIDAEEIDKRYKQMAFAFSLSGDNVIKSVEEIEQYKEVEALLQNQKQESK